MGNGVKSAGLSNHHLKNGFNDRGFVGGVNHGEKHIISVEVNCGNSTSGQQLFFDIAVKPVYLVDSFRDRNGAFIFQDIAALLPIT